jgi:hypothetical protein
MRKKTRLFMKFGLWWQITKLLLTVSAPCSPERGLILSSGHSCALDSATKQGRLYITNYYNIYFYSKLPFSEEIKVSCSALGIVVMVVVHVVFAGTYSILIH